MKVGIVNVTGYSGCELARILYRHPEVELTSVPGRSAAGFGGVAVLYPLISQMAPSADVLAESTTEVDVSAIEPGQSRNTQSSPRYSVAATETSIDIWRARASADESPTVLPSLIEPLR